MDYKKYYEIMLIRKDLVKPIHESLSYKFGFYFMVDNRTDSEDTSTHNHIFVLKEGVTPVKLAQIRLYAHGLVQGVRIAIDNKITE